VETDRPAATKHITKPNARDAQHSVLENDRREAGQAMIALLTQHHVSSRSF
jgi:hypothetical protein